MGLYEFLDNRRTLWFFLGLLVVLVVVTYLTAGVYREVSIQGKVWEWVNAPEGAAGMVYSWKQECEESENWAPPPGTELQPLGGVYISYDTVFRGRQYDKMLTISGKDGHFFKKARGWKLTGDITLNMATEKEGYNSVGASFVNEGKPNVVYIILTRAE